MTNEKALEINAILNKLSTVTAEAERMEAER
jgi:hypothetical protein